jgi:hypothetical protein
MRNVYNKGKFRNGEYAKHLRPFLKKVGNKKWRQFAKEEISDELTENYDESIPELQYKCRLPRKRKTIKLKITKDLGHHGLSSVYRSYSSERAVSDSLKRNNIIRYKTVR